MIKECSCCHTPKPLGAFNKLSKSKDGLAYRCRDCQNEASRKWLAANKEYDKERQQKYYIKNAEKRKQYTREFNRLRPEYAKEYYEAHLEERTRYKKRWNKENSERLMDYSWRRRALKQYSCAESVSRKLVFERDSWVCQHPSCGKPVDPSLVWPDPFSASLDHMVPLSKGGAHSYENVTLMYLRCNLCKGSDILTNAITFGEAPNA